MLPADLHWTQAVDAYLLRLLESANPPTSSPLDRLVTPLCSDSLAT